MDEPIPLGELAQRALSNLRDRQGFTDEQAAPTIRTWDLDEPEAFITRAVTLTDEQVPARYQGATISQQAVADWVRELLNATGQMGSRLGKGRSLLLLGDVGRGKTHEGFAAIRAIAAAGISVRWQAMTEGDLFARLRPRQGVDSETEFQSIVTAPLLLLDDLGSAKTSEWTEEITYRVINQRYERVLPTILTSNVLPDQLKTVLGDRVASRLVEMASRVVLTGPDRRRTQKAA